MTRRKAQPALIDETPGRTIAIWMIALTVFMTLFFEFEHVVELLS